MGALKPCYNIFCYRRLSAETKLGLFVTMSGIEWQVGGSMRQRVEQIACPACGKYQSMDIFETVNTAVDPTVRDRILRRELFLYRCASCGHEMAVSYDCVYKDIGYRFIVYLVPPQTPPDLPPRAAALFPRLSVGGGEGNDRLSFTVHECSLLSVISRPCTAP